MQDYPSEVAVTTDKEEWGIPTATAEFIQELQTENARLDTRYKKLYNDHCKISRINERMDEYNTKLEATNARLRETIDDAICEDALHKHCLSRIEICKHVNCWKRKALEQ